MSAVIMRGDARDLPLPDESVDLICTSPPYFGQRDYRDGAESLAGQIGSEDTPREYLAALLDCTREWMRVLKPEGSLFVNLGDKYSQRVAARRSSHQDGLFPGRPELQKDWKRDRAAGLARMPNQNVIDDDGHWVAEKSLLGLPWRYAIGCMDDLGLILRRDNIWSKNGLPESVTDRCQTAHEYLFHLTKNPRYYSACDEIREPLRAPGRAAGAGAFGGRNASIPRTATGDYGGQNPLGKIPGSVWEIQTEPLLIPPRIAHARCCGGPPRPGCEDGLAHHAAFPTALPRRIILGWSPPGICAACGEGRCPKGADAALDMERPQARRAQQLADRAGLTEEHFQALLSVGVSDTGRGAATQSGTGKNTAEVYRLAAQARSALGGYAREYLLRRPTRLAYNCGCPDTSAATRPAIVADPFGGTGTTALVADALGRTGISFDRSAGYCDLARWRTTDPGERAKAMQVPKPPPVPEGQDALFDLFGAAS